jgi:hypothetical protein
MIATATIEAPFETPTLPTELPEPTELPTELPTESAEGAEAEPAESKAKKKPWIMSYFRKVGDEYIYDSPCMRQFRPRAVPDCPKERIDRTAEITIERLTKDIRATMDPERLGKLESHTGDRLGRYRNVVTDGRRALLIPNGPKANHKTWQVSSIPAATDPHFEVDDPGLYLALRRIMVISKEQDDEGGWAAFRFVPELGTLNITTIYGGEFEGRETIGCSGIGPESFELVLNPRFILPALGFWPIRFYFSDAKSPVSIMPVGRQFLYVVMPRTR